MLKIVVISVIFSIATSQGDAETTNNKPIIGILTQEISYSLKKIYKADNYNSYIAASYVKFVEGAGARVVPIWIGQNESYYIDITTKINGVLWPGGATFFNQSNGYADAGYYIYKAAKQMNKRGEYFPIFSICLGFELLTYLSANRIEHRSNCWSMHEKLPLEFVPGFRESRMFNKLSDDLHLKLQNENLTSNSHRYCVTKKNLQSVGLAEKFRILSYNHDTKGLKFISALEHVTFPFYGLQFHPEKNLYEWVPKKYNIPHGKHSTESSQYFADFFVNEARKNMNHYPTEEEEMKSLIYNYPVTYTGATGASYTQCYFFKRNHTWAASNKN